MLVNNHRLKDNNINQKIELRASQLILTHVIVSYLKKINAT